MLSEYLKSINFFTVAAFACITVFISSCTNPIFGYLVIGALMMILAQLNDKSILLFFFLLSVLMQNFFISIFSPIVKIQDLSLNVLLGSNFVIPCVLFLIIFLKEGLTSKVSHKRLMEFLPFILSISFFLIGSVIYGIQGAAVYLRYYIIMFLMFSCGLWLSRKTSLEKIDSFFKVFSIVVLLLICFEYLFPTSFYYLFNIDVYHSLKYGYGVDAQLVYEHNVSRYFNNALFREIRLIRVGGPVVNPISSAYLICFLMTYFLVKRKYVLAVLSLFSILILAASKGALVSSLLILIVYYFYHRNPLRYSLKRSLLIIIPVVSIVVILGAFSFNEHIVGFLGGIKNLYQKPLGQGLGVAGNFSSSTIDGEFAEYLEKFENGTESAWGVLFTSLGLFSIIYLLGVLKFINRNIKESKINGRQNFWNFGLVIIFFSGIYQEEAFSPYALGMFAFMAGANSYWNYKTRVL